jgi:alpha-D-ribose 1-methylphosphonate 5-triphosphate synthase subunit PhnH
MTTLAAGFADASHDAQQVFRAVLDAFAHPGRIVRIIGKVEPPHPLCEASTAFLLTLADRDTPLWLAPAFDTPEVRDFVRFHCGAPIVASERDALFAVVPGARQPMFEDFVVGTDPYPDRSATLVIEVPSLGGGPEVTLRGPGIDGTAAAAVAGLADRFWHDWLANHALFPCGVDVVFAAGTELLALPRSIAVEV